MTGTLLAAAATAPASLLTATGAWAICTPASTSPVPAPGTTVTCSGTTTNQDPLVGYGTGLQNGLIINVQSGASVTGTVVGFGLGTANTINNSGLIQGGIGAVGLVTGINTGAAGDVTVVNNTGGSIVAVTTAVGGTALGIIGNNSANLTNASGASITVTAGGGEAVGVQGNAVTVNNAGTITVSGGLGSGSFGVFGINSTTVVNSGTIAVDDTGGAVEAIGVLSTGTLNVTNNAGGVIQATGTIGVGVFGTAGGTITNAGAISGSFDGINTLGPGTAITNAATGNITGTTDAGIRVDTATITNNGTVSGLTGIFFRPGNGASTVFNSGTVTGTGGTAIQFSTGSVGNTLTLGPGFAINGNVIGAGSDILQLGGTGTGTFNVSNIGAAQQYQGFVTFNKIDASTWTLTGNGAQAWTVQAGTLLVDGTVGNVTVQSGATLGGIGTVGGLVVGSGATVAPGHSIGTLSVAGAVSFAGGSIYQVEANAAGQSDKIAATGAAALAGGTVQVLAQLGGYAPSTKYTILTAAGGVAGTFANVTSNLAFLTPTLSYDPNDVFLTLTRNATQFSSVAQTPNQKAVAGALDAAPGGGLVGAVLLLTNAGAQQAFDALSGEVHASTQAEIIDDARYARQAMLARLRQMPYGPDAGAMAALGGGGPALSYADPALAYAGIPKGAYAANLPVKAAPLPVAPVPDLVFWAQGLGAWGRIDGDGNAAGLHRDLAGFFTGLDRRFGDWRAGLAAGYTNSKSQRERAGELGQDRHRPCRRLCGQELRVLEPAHRGGRRLQHGLEQPADRLPGLQRHRECALRRHHRAAVRRARLRPGVRERGGRAVRGAGLGASRHRRLRRDRRPCGPQRGERQSGRRLLDARRAVRHQLSTEQRHAAHAACLGGLGARLRQRRAGRVAGVPEPRHRLHDRGRAARARCRGGRCRPRPAGDAAGHGGTVVFRAARQQRAGPLRQGKLLLAVLSAVPASNSAGRLAVLRRAHQSTPRPGP